MKDFFRRNGILILIAAVLLALVTAVVSALLGGAADPLSNLANLITTPIRNGINAVVNWTGERYSDAFEQEQLKQENRGAQAAGGRSWSRWSGSTRPPFRRTSGCGT